MRGGFRTCMIILILAGVLIGGIGTGIAFAEFSELEYEGTVWLGGEEETTITLKYELSGQGADRIYCHSYMNIQEDIVVQEDRKVPLNEIWFEVTYDPAYVEPVVSQEGIYHDGENLREDMSLWTIRNTRDGLQDLMNIKDKILEELKENKISSYEYAPVISVNVQVNPVNAGKMSIMR